MRRIAWIAFALLTLGIIALPAQAQQACPCNWLFMNTGPTPTPGVTPGFVQAAMIATASPGASPNVTFSATPAAGDLLVAMYMATQETNQGTNIGWTQIAFISQATYDCELAWRIAVPGEPATEQPFDQLGGTTVVSITEVKNFPGNGTTGTFDGSGCVEAVAANPATATLTVTNTAINDFGVALAIANVNAETAIFSTGWASELHLTTNSSYALATSTLTSMLAPSLIGTWSGGTSSISDIVGVYIK
jgi:hypothetical protein